MRDFTIVEFNNMPFKVERIDSCDERLCSSGDYCMGIALYRQCEVLVANNISSSAQETAVLIHELTHAALFSHGYHQIEQFTKEQVCDIVAALYDEISAALTACYE